MKYKRFYRILPVILVVVTLTSGIVANGATDPYVSAFSKNADAGLPVTFTGNDFLSNVVGDGKLEGIVFTSLPEGGTMYVGSRKLYVGEAVTTQNLDSLYFQPAGDMTTTGSFSYIPVFENSNGKISTVSLATFSKENTAPVAEDVEYETIKNIAITGKFKVNDDDGDDLSCKIQTSPKKGDVAISEDDPCTFVYTPHQNKTGTDTFTYMAVDAEGKTSQVAKVTVKISKNAAKMTYADMDMNPAHFAAIKLAEEGILIGERMGDNYFFSPEKPVSRSEFVALALTCLGADVVSPVSKTGFADDADIPTWVKPYISTALKNGIISGVNTPDGRRVFRPSSTLTKAEAAVILNNATDLEPSSNSPVFADNDAVPAWAASAIANTAAYGILSVSSQGIEPMINVTRAEAAQMLYNAMQVYNQSNAGLLSRIFG